MRESRKKQRKAETDVEGVVAWNVAARFGETFWTQNRSGKQKTHHKYFATSQKDYFKNI